MSAVESATRSVPWRWYLIPAALFGVLAGVGSYTFVYAKGASYLSNDAAACVNCHAMNEQYAAWTRSSHRAAAVCNDCHTPAGHVAKYLTKANNGFWHSFAFTTGWYPEHIRATPRNKAIAEASCQKCHAAITTAITTGHPTAEPMSCVRCHDSVGHLR